MKKDSSISKKIITIACLVFVVLGAWYFTRIVQGYDGEKAAWVYIPQDATKDQASDSLRSSLGNGFGGRVAMLLDYTPENSHGAYRIEPGEKVWQIARKISQGRQTPVRVTFNNVRTFGELADRLAARMEFTPDQFLAASKQIAEEEGISEEQLESEFLPDTYEAYWTATPQQLISKIRDNYSRFWNNERRSKAASIGLTPLQASTLASIVEEETNKRDERPAVARLYLNRLSRGMKLQADPTVRFAKGDFTIKRVTGDMLTIQSPYNTYVVSGLPPGIIRLPEARTIDQVLSAPAHNYIYMCARPDGSGYHDFTADYSTHLANARKYRNAVFGK